MISLLLAAALLTPSDAPSATIKAAESIETKDGKIARASFEDAVRVNIRSEMRERLVPILAAIRHAENGRAGREYGVLHPKALGKSYRVQCGWAAATIQKNWDRWKKAGSKGKFIVFLGNRYCPVGAGNDPDNLNRHWIKNVTKFATRFGYEDK